MTNAAMHAVSVESVPVCGICLEFVIVLVETIQRTSRAKMPNREERKKLKEFKKLLEASSLGSPEVKKMRKIGKKAIKDLDRRRKYGTPE